MSDLAERLYRECFPNAAAERRRALDLAKADGVSDAGLRQLSAVLDQIRAANLATIEMALGGNRTH